MSNDNVKQAPSIGIRHLQMLLIFLIINVNVFMRLSVSVTLLAMTTSYKHKSAEFDWTEAEKSYVLSSFYWGYLVSSFLGGFQVRRFGVRLTLLVMTLSCGLFTISIPCCISWGGWQAFCAIRILLGLLQGALYPAAHQHLSKWCPPKELNRLGTFAYMGCYCGTLLSMMSGYIASAWGWRGISYVSAALSGVVALLWWLFSANNAPSSRLIGKQELEYIEHSMLREQGFHTHRIPIPWRAILTSAPFISLTIVSTAESWFNAMLLTQTNSYLHGVLELSLKGNALLSSLPSLVKWLMSYVCICFADLSNARNWMAQTTLAKLLNTIATWGPALALIGIGLLDKQHTELAVALLTLNSALSAGTNIGSNMPVASMSPNHSSILLSILNGTSNVFALFAPLLAGAIVTHTTSRAQWQIVFALTSLILFVGNLVYIIWGSVETQPWDALDFLKQPNKVLQRNPQQFRT